MPLLTSIRSSSARSDGCERLVGAKPMDRDVVLMRTEKRACLRAELLKVVLRRVAEQVNLGLGSHLVFEVGVDDLPLLLFNQAHEQPQSLPRILEHGRGDVLPPVVGLDLFDQEQLLLDHRDARLFFEQAGDRAHLIPQPVEPRLVTQQSELQSQHQEVEAFGLLILGRLLCRQAGNLGGEVGDVFLTQVIPSGRAREFLDQLALGSDDEVVDVHRCHFVVQHQRRGVAERGLLVRRAVDSGSRSVEFRDQFEPGREQPLSERVDETSLRSSRCPG